MNRAAITAVLVVLLTIQGSVAGVLTSGAFSNDAGNNTTVEQTTEVTTDGSLETGSTSVMAANNEDSTETSSTTTTASETTSTTATSPEKTTTPTSTGTETPTETDTTTPEKSETTTTDEPSDTTDKTDDSGKKSPSKPESPTQSPTSTDGPTLSGDNGGKTASEGKSPSGGAGGASGAPQGGAGSATPPASVPGGAGGPSRSGGANAPAASAGQSPNGPSAAAAGARRTAGAAPAGADAAPPGSAPSGAAGGAPGAARGATGGAPGGTAGRPSAASRAAGRPSAAGAGGAPSGAAAGGAGSATAASPDAEFNVTAVSSDVPVGGTGNISVTIENTGEDATDAVVNLQSQSGDLVFGQSAKTSRYVGDWDEGESRTIEVSARAMRGADTDEYPVQATVSYDDDDGNASQSAPLTFGVTPASEQGFTLSSVDDDLAAGAEGTISGTITNEGPEQATDAVIALSPNGSRAVVPRQSQYVLGDLDADESESFEYPVLVNSTAEPGARQVSFVVQYYDADGNPLRSKPLNARVDIDAEGDDFEIVDVETDVEAGEQGTLSVTMNNTGENVTDATVNFQSLSSGILFGQAANTSRFVEEWNTGDRRTFEFDIVAGDGATGASYPLQASLSYDDADGDRGRAGPIRFGVTPNEGQDDFAVVSTSSEVQVGDEGPVSVTLENRGENVTEATVSLQSLTGDILFGRTANATQYIGEWPAGAQRTVTVNATASNQSETRSYPLQTSISYKNSDGDQGRSGPFTLGITPQPEQSFALGNTSSTLSVGDEGNVTGTITNRGPQDARNAVIRLVSRSQNIEPKATEVALGSLSANESTTFSVPVEVTDSAEPGSQQFSFVVEYDNRNGDTRRSGTLDTQVDIGPQSDAFIVERANASLDVGGSDTVTLNVTNNRESTVSNVNAKAFVDDPLSIASDEAYISRLEPNETRQIAFDVSASGDANAGEYPLSVDFQYDTASGESKLSNTYEVPVELVETEDGGILSSLSITWALGALLVVFGVAWVWSRRS